MKVNKNGDLWWICSELVCLRPSANVGFISVVDWEKTLNLCVYVVRLIYSVGWWGWIQTVLLLITCQMRRINFFICIVLSSGESNWPFNSHQRGNISPSSPSSHRLHNLGHLPASHPAWNNFSGGIIYSVEIFLFGECLDFLSVRMLPDFSCCCYCVCVYRA